MECQGVDGRQMHEIKYNIQSQIFITVCVFNGSCHDNCLRIRTITTSNISLFKHSSIIDITVWSRYLFLFFEMYPDLHVYTQNSLEKDH